MPKTSFGRLDSITSVSVGYFMAVMLITGVATLSYRSTYKLVDAGRWVSHTAEVQAALEAIMEAVTETETSQRGFVIAGTDGYLERFNAACVDSHRHFEELRQLTSDNAQQRTRLDMLVRAVDLKMAWQSQIISAYKTQGRSAAEAMIASGQDIRLMRDIDQLVEQMKAEEEGLLKRRTEDAGQRASGMIRNLVILAVCTLVLLTVPYVLIIRDLRVRDQMEEQLRQSHRKLQISLEAEQRLARTDPLTGLANRRAFYEAAESERIRAQRYLRPLALLYMDIDNFKRVNDLEGHARGDELLRLVASTIAPLLRSTDIFARLGGDEFAIVLPETTQGLAENVVERIKVALEEAVPKRVWNVGFSMGIAGYQHSPDSLDVMMRAADERMYAAKAAVKAP